MTYVDHQGEEGYIGVGCVPAPGTAFASVTLTADDMFSFGFADWFNVNIATRMIQPTKEKRQ